MILRPLGEVVWRFGHADRTYILLDQETKNVYVFPVGFLNWICWRKKTVLPVITGADRKHSNITMSRTECVREQESANVSIVNKLVSPSPA